MKDKLIEHVYSIMSSRIKISSPEKYIYANKIVFPKMEGKSSVESFFSTFPILAKEYFDKIVDELHPY